MTLEHAWIFDVGIILIMLNIFHSGDVELHVNECCCVEMHTALVLTSIMA
jgi:hypothetical protein